MFENIRCNCEHFKICKKTKQQLSFVNQSVFDKNVTDLGGDEIGVKIGVKL